MKKLLVVALIGLTCDLAAMDSTTGAGAGSPRALPHEKTETPNLTAVQSALLGSGRTDAEELQFLNYHCSTGTLTLEMYENRKKDDRYVHIYEKFVESNRATIDAVLAQTEYATFEQLENAYTALLFVRSTHNLDYRVLGQFTVNHIQLSGNKITAEQTLYNASTSNANVAVNDVTKVEQAYKAAKMFYGLHINEANDRKKARIEWWKKQLEALKEITITQ